STVRSMSDTVGLQAVGTELVTARHIAANNNVAMHWQVTERSDGVEIGERSGDSSRIRR
ncbi:MAG: hypothetical protein ACI88S_001514, partial [Ilumatobacter sp.]